MSAELPDGANMLKTLVLGPETRWRPKGFLRSVSEILKGIREAVNGDPQEGHVTGKGRQQTPCYQGWDCPQR